MGILITIIIIICLVGFYMTMQVTKEDGSSYNSEKSARNMTYVYVLAPVVVLVLIVIISLTGGF
ncbi:BshB3 potential contributor to bacillithiol synthesis [Alkalihalobacterium chitinilyticum]|uniref:BshB3 potential contributor to bacillithiol synthesis n=1 Tax=Alkalihalobacterium chitinilyticum TaxID=2980103 RepID=A0ABT5VKT6_9BACI|nr:BshB3 potential contributor to bacillithiol synthesis [Alkalihalobacterium chitinilyticum]MDE5416044.1 BshB3 potential contributor to bacillithiol synthesis [Alkalihalobacterium chitinilyticum]